MALKPFYDVVIIGGGHNGLVSAAYLARTGVSVCLLEKRHVLGGAAVTEEIISGFQFSRASYLLSLLRPHIYTDLELKKHGLKLFTRDPKSYTPLRQNKWSNAHTRSLTLGADREKNLKEISKFSRKDAENYDKYEKYIENIVDVLDPLFDVTPHDLNILLSKHVNIVDKLHLLITNKHIRKCASSLFSSQAEIKDIFSMLTCSAHTILSSWFESEPLKATLLTDGLIGAMVSPHSPSTGYVLLHHVMGGVNGVKGAWAYPQGGMGAVSKAIAKCAEAHGAELFVNKAVKEILLTPNKETRGVVTVDGQEIQARYVLSNATLKSTLLDLVPPNTLEEKMVKMVENIDYTSPVTKINVALRSIPNFLSDPNTNHNSVMPHHQCSIHLNCEDSQQVADAYNDASRGMTSTNPMIEMVLPSSLDPTLSPKGHHVCLLFTQFTPYKLNGQDWTSEHKTNYANTVFSNIEEYCPGFRDSIVGYEILTPQDLEKEFGLTGGNIFHGALSLEQIFFNRPLSNVMTNSPFTPISNLILCGSGAHPGGGVCGAPGYLAAQIVKKLLKKQRNVKKKQSLKAGEYFKSYKFSKAKR